MGKGKPPARRPQRAKRSGKRVSKQQNQLYAVRRPVHESSLGLFRDLYPRLDTEIGGAGRLFVPNSLAVTIVGFTRFRRPDPRKNIRTVDIAEKVVTAHHQIPATIGKLGVYGAGSKHKLAFALESSLLEDEVEAFEHKFEDAGYPLRRDHNAEGDGVSLHCSVALINSDFVGYFQDTDTLSRLDSVAKVCGKSITLASVHRPDSL